MDFVWLSNGGDSITTYKSWEPILQVEGPSSPTSTGSWCPYKILFQHDPRCPRWHVESKRHWRRGLLWHGDFPQGFMTFLSHARSWRKRPPGKRHVPTRQDMPTWGERRENSKFFVFCQNCYGGEVQQFKHKVSLPSNSWVVVSFFFQTFSPLD